MLESTPILRFLAALRFSRLWQCLRHYGYLFHMFNDPFAFLVEMGIGLIILLIGLRIVPVGLDDMSDLESSVICAIGVVLITLPFLWPLFKGYLDD